MYLAGFGIDGDDGFVFAAVWAFGGGDEFEPVGLDGDDGGGDVDGAGLAVDGDWGLGVGGWGDWWVDGWGSSLCRGNRGGGGAGGGGK